VFSRLITGLGAFSTRPEARFAPTGLSVRGPLEGLSVRRLAVFFTSDVRDVLSVLSKALFDALLEVLSRDPVILRDVVLSRALCSIGVSLSGRTNDPNLGLQAKYRTRCTEPSFLPMRKPKESSITHQLYINYSSKAK
jgi:hypothetical protein